MTAACARCRRQMHVSAMAMDEQQRRVCRPSDRVSCDRLVKQREAHPIETERQRKAARVAADAAHAPGNTSPTDP